jgi:hypothetical protein
MKLVTLCGWQVAACIFLTAHAPGQGFINLDFEMATIAPTPVGEFGPLQADPLLAFPGWTMGSDGSQNPNYTLYNNLTIGSVAQVLIGPSYPNGTGITPLQGAYSALLQFGPSLELGVPALSQVGLLPANARSINFLVHAFSRDAVVTLDGHEIPLLAFGPDRLAGDVSGFAGQMVELRISTRSYNGGGLYFDDIRFSPVTVPEPTVVQLATAGIICFGLWHRFVKALGAG